MELFNALLLCCLLIANNVIDAFDANHHPVYHFRPKEFWMSDPNGPFYYNGIYHLFFQWNPREPIWRSTIWAHAVSTDLINWKHLPVPGIEPSKPWDQKGAWSGSATIGPNNIPYLFYTGRPTDNFTGIIDTNHTQVQCIAVAADPSDPYLTEWIKPDNNPIVYPDKYVNKSAFRDPSTAWKGPDGLWRFVIGSAQTNKTRGIIYMYKSNDFSNWKRVKKPLYSRIGFGMMECVDFFPVSIQGKNALDYNMSGPDTKHVLKSSIDMRRYDVYVIGKYDFEKEKFQKDSEAVDNWNALRLDYGNMYASKTFFDPVKNRRILWGWANESDSIPQQIEKGWASVYASPRSIWLDPKGKQLLQWPIEELETLRDQHVQLVNKQLAKGENVEIKGIKAEQADIEVTFALGSLDKAEPFDSTWDGHDAQKLCGLKPSSVQGVIGPFGLLTLASEKLEEYTPVFFRIFKAKHNYKVLMCSDARSSSVNVTGLYLPSFGGFVDVDLIDKKLSLRTLIDRSVVESFGAGGKTVILSRVYPALAVMEKAHLFTFNNGSEPIVVEKLNAWSMINIKI